MFLFDSNEIILQNMFFLIISYFSVLTFQTISILHTNKDKSHTQRDVHFSNSVRQLWPIECSKVFNFLTIYSSSRHTTQCTVRSSRGVINTHQLHISGNLVVQNFILARCYYLLHAVWPLSVRFDLLYNSIVNSERPFAEPSTALILP